MKSTMTPQDSWIACQLLGNRHVNGEMDQASADFVRIFRQMNESPWDQRQGLWEDFRKNRSDAGAIAQMVADVVPTSAFPSCSPGPTDAVHVQPNEADDDPSRLAKLHIEVHHSHPEGRTLQFWKGELFEYTRGAYQPVGPDDIRARLYRTIKTEFDRLNVLEIQEWKDQGSKKTPPEVRKVTKALVGNSHLALSAHTQIDSNHSQPCWLKGNPPFPAEDILPTRNALIYLPAYIKGDPSSVHQPTPSFFSTYALDYDFNEDFPEPANWIEFLHSIFGDDTDSIESLQEWFGYQLTPDTRYQKIGMLIGPKRSGKGTIARVLRAMIGPENTANPTLSSLGTNFGIAPLIGKPSAVITDARLSGRADVSQIVERLLSISGEDGQTIDRKHLPAVTVRLPTRFLLISNELPRLSETSGALAGRLIVWKLTRSFYGHEDTDLEKRLMPELPGILNWAIKGWARLRARGKFIQPSSATDLVEEMEQLTSPVGTFIKERCTLDPQAEVLAGKLFDAWKRWCTENGRDHPGDSQNFGRSLRAVIPNLETFQPRSEGRKRVYKGIDLLLDF